MSPKRILPKAALLLILAGLVWVMAPGFQLEFTADAKPAYKELKLFTDVLDLIKQNYVDPVDEKKLIESAIQGMVGSLDPHSALLTPEAFRELQIDTHGEFTGIGIHVTMRDNLVTVIAPIEGTPAYRAGIKAGDRIVKVDGKQTDNLRDAVNRMRGPKGTKVVVTIIREGEPKPLEFTLVRDVIPIHSVKSAILKPGYGYVWVTNFRDNTYDDLVAALDTMESAKPPLKGLILDLRDNPGGILDQAIKVCDLFLDKGVILSSKGRKGAHVRVYKAHKNAKSRSYPMVVLINGGSASASEIVAGALQDHKRALLLGTTSFGKGSVQAIENLSDGYALKLTIARYYTPSGRSIQAKGVEPDIFVARRILESDAKAATERTIKEKDLKNHLGAEPNDTRSKSSKDREKEKSKLPPKVQSRISPLDVNQLLRDSQVSRALDILIGYQVFKQTNNG